MKSFVFTLVASIYVSAQLSCTPVDSNNSAENSSEPESQAVVDTSKQLERQKPMRHYTEYTPESDDELKKRLTAEQFHVTRENGTERPYSNEYWDNKKEGIYVDIISGEPLFSSTTKYDSRSGWPSFTAPIDPKTIVELKDTSYGMTRVEIRSKRSDAHLGHLFTDGPKPSGLRYCVNSASVRFVPKEKLEAEGYSEFLKLFAEVAK